MSCVPGPYERSKPCNGKLPALQLLGMKHSKLLVHGPKTLASTNLNVCFIQSVGLRVNLILSFDGMGEYAWSISNRAIPSSKFAESLQHQLRFYGWLWHETHDGQCIDGLEGWYLNGPHRIVYDAPQAAEYTEMTSRIFTHQH